MSRYIDADALKMELYSIAKADCGYTADVLAGLMIAERVIDNAQTADVAPVRHGQWTEKGYCSRCGCDIPVMEDDYCPKCGARMDGDTQEREGV